MKIYRTVSQEELEDIQKYHRIRFQNPFWNFKSEGKIVDIFRDIVDLQKKDQVKGKIKKWVKSYIDSDEKIQEYLKNDNCWYSIFTELSQITYLFFTNYCKSFSKVKKEINTNREKEDVAIIEIDSELDKNIIVKCEDENKKLYHLKLCRGDKVYDLTKSNSNHLDAYIREYDVKYNERNNYDTLFKEFSDDRCLIELLRTIPMKYEWQNEKRWFININMHKSAPTIGINSLGGYISKKYIGEQDVLKIYGSKESESYFDDFIEALYLQFVLTYIEIESTLPKNIYVFFPKDSIKIVKLLEQKGEI